MPSRTSTWPEGWPSFTTKDNDPKDTYQQDLKSNIIAKFGADNLRASWIKTCKALSTITSCIAASGNKAIPIFTYDKLDTGQESLEAMKETGCCIIRGVIPKGEASQHFLELQSFISDNRDVVTGWPAKSVAIYHLYSSPTQLKLKTNSRHLKVQKLLNGLWTDTSISTSEEDALSEPVLYPDAFRIRHPGQDFLGLGPHIDGGSLCRWADASYLEAYASILSGNPEQYNPYGMSSRKNADMSMFPGGAQCSVFRAFQGWTALTPCQPGSGGLMLLPEVKVVTAYMMLRPFFREPADGDWEIAEKWEFDDSAWFPGTYRWDSQLLSRESHPHLKLEECLVSIPEIEPGDTVWWHADMCHAVETTHNGSEISSVVYIPAAPSTPLNIKYIRQYWKDLVAGTPPEDYKYLDGTGSELVSSKQNEREMKGALALDSISAEGRRGLGEGR